MWSYLLSLPRASWRMRGLFALLLLLIISVLPLEFDNLHAPLAPLRWMTWMSVCCGLVYIPRIMIVVLLGRRPRSFQRFDRLNKTLPQIHGQLRREKREQAERKRDM